MIYLGIWLAHQPPVYSPLSQLSFSVESTMHRAVLALLHATSASLVDVDGVFIPACELSGIEMTDIDGSTYPEAPHSL